MSSVAYKILDPLSGNVVQVGNMDSRIVPILQERGELVEIITDEELVALQNQLVTPVTEEGNPGGE